MKTSSSSPATRKFRVHADCIAGVYQEVTAASPEEALRLAANNKDEWQGFEAEDNEYVVSNTVHDMATGDCISVGEISHCKTRGSEFLPIIKERTFREGEYYSRATS
jgi:hypothetical protein